MASSFDQVTEKQEWQQITVEDVDYFSVVTDLYSQYRSMALQIRGSALQHGQVKELPLDLCLSVECVLKSSGLTLRERTLFTAFAAHGVEAVNKCLPPSVKKLLQAPFRTIYFEFPQLVQQAFRARGTQLMAEQRKTKAEADATFALETTIDSNSVDSEQTLQDGQQRAEQIIAA